MPDEVKQSTIAELMAMHPPADSEAAHQRADGLLLAFIEEMGYPDVAQAFRDADDRVHFYYS